MLLNEFLKEHRKVEEREATIAKQQKDFTAAIAELEREMQTIVTRLHDQDANIQRISDQVELNSGDTKVVANKP